MACCECCCPAGCCGGSSGTCCAEGEYCCDGVCEPDPCCSVDGDCDPCGCENGWYTVPPGGPAGGCCPDGAEWDEDTQTCGGSTPGPLLAWCCDGACSCEECPP